MFLPIYVFGRKCKHGKSKPDVATYLHISTLMVLNACSFIHKWLINMSYFYFVFHTLSKTDSVYFDILYFFFFFFTGICQNDPRAAVLLYHLHRSAHHMFQSMWSGETQHSPQHKWQPEYERQYRSHIWTKTGWKISFSFSSFLDWL